VDTDTRGAEAWQDPTDTALRPRRRRPNPTDLSRPRREPFPRSSGPGGREQL
jgi:hypothetical protein